MSNNFSENLKKIRKDNNMSQEELAEELGVSRQAISKWESAVSYPEMDKIIALCELFSLNIDDLLHKDIREVKGEEETKKNLNKYIDDFLSFITNTINLFSNMSFKSKIKCLLEQCVIGFSLFMIFLIIGSIFKSLLGGVFTFLPHKFYFVIYSIIKLFYVIFGICVSLMIMLHIYKTRYLEYYEKIKKEVTNDECKNEIVELQDKNDDKESENISKKNMILFKRNENKIIIRDPKHSEYKFISSLSRIIVGIIKFFVLCFSLILFITLIGLVFGFVISFLAYRTGMFFVGLLILFIALIVINIDFILMVLNFIFNRKNDKKKVIWSIIISFVLIGIGSGLVSIGAIDFEYVVDDKSFFYSDYIEFDMSDNLFFDYYVGNNVEYVESDIDNIRIEYELFKNFEIDYYLNSSGIYLFSNCADPIGLIKEVINNFNDKKIISINSEIQSIKIYGNKENILKLKNNRSLYYNELEKREGLINSYEERISKLEEENRNYLNKINEYEQEITILEDRIFKYENVE